jgi:hypothetical protein
LIVSYKKGLKGVKLTLISGNKKMTLNTFLSRMKLEINKQTLDLVYIFLLPLSVQNLL